MGAGGGDPVPLGTTLTPEQAALLPEEALESWALFQPAPGNKVASVTIDDEDFVFIDAHILATPAVADVDGDERADLVIAVSYFFDAEVYSTASNLPDGFLPTKYVAGGLLCYDLVGKKWKWTVHLDLTTDETSYRAYMYSAPTVVDLDADGSAEVIVGTSLGFVYVLDGGNGGVREGWPVQFGEVQAQVVAADVVGDSALEVIVGDSNGNLVVLDASGNEIWERQLPGRINSAPAVGDVDSDGRADIVVALSKPHGEGSVWALSGGTGEPLDYYPQALPAADTVITSPVLLVDLHGEGKHGGRTAGLHIVVPVRDGHVYVIEGATGCTNKIDVGEHSYSMVLADDLTGDGAMDLLVSTMNGNLLCFSSPVPFDPLNAARTQSRGGNMFSHSSRYLGLRMGSEAWVEQHVMGNRVIVSFEIVDERSTVEHPEYHVAVKRGEKEVLFEASYTEPGFYSETFSLSKPEHVTLTVHMETEAGQQFQDDLRIAFNVDFQRTLKWVLVLPFSVMAAIMLLIGDLKPSLPM